MIMFVQPDPDFDVWFGVTQKGKNRKVMIIKSRYIAGDDPWEASENGRIIFAGGVITELRRLLKRYGRYAINSRTKCDEYPDGVLYSGSGYDAMRFHLGLTTYRDKRQVEKDPPAAERPSSPNPQHSIPKIDAFDNEEKAL